MLLLYSFVTVWCAGQGGFNSFTELLKAGDDSGNYSQFVTLLRSMSPTAIDQEVRALEVRVSNVIAHLYCISEKFDLQPLVFNSWNTTYERSSHLNFVLWLYPWLQAGQVGEQVNARQDHLSCA